MQLGDHLIAAWSRVQPRIALSSGEAELYAGMRGVSETLEFFHMMREFKTSDRARIVAVREYSIEIESGSHTLGGGPHPLRRWARHFLPSLSVLPSDSTVPITLLLCLVFLPNSRHLVSRATVPCI